MTLHRNVLNLLSAAAMAALFVSTSARVSAANRATSVAGGGKNLLVYVLAGQSNMVGHAKGEEGRNPKFDPMGPKGKENPEYIAGGLGSLRAMVNESPAKFGPKGTTPLVDANGKWLVRKDVKIYAYCDEKTKKGNLTLGYAAPAAVTWLGPEFGFGHVVGNALADDVLIIKISTGGTSLAGNWRSPSAVAKRGGEVGPQYIHLVKTAKEVLADAAKHPEFKGNVAVVDTRPMWRDASVSPSNFGYHWNHNGFTHYEIGAGMGEEMLKLMKHK